MIKLWHLVIVFFTAPYFFYWLSLDAEKGLRLINFWVCIGVLILIGETAFNLKALNEYLDKDK